MTDKAELPLSYSLYLDILRFTAALAVYLSHIAVFPFVEPVASGAARSPLALYGTPAVTVFFVLSGYVIAYVVATRERDARTFAISRISRLYSVVIPALAVTLLLDRWGASIDPVLYARGFVAAEPVTTTGYVASFFLLNEFQAFGFHGIMPGSNGPWWSLSFEAAYYLLAGVAVFARRWVAVIAGLIIFAIVGRTIVALLPLWALGYFLFRWRETLVRALPLPQLCWILSTGAFLAIPWLVRSSPDMNFGVHFPWGLRELNRNLAQDYALAFAVAVHLVAADKLLAGATWSPSRSIPVIRFLGATTFPLYAMHRPAMIFLLAVSPWPAASVESIAFVTVAIAVGVAFATPLCDGLKVVLRDRLARAWPPRSVAVGAPAGTQAQPSPPP